MPALLKRMAILAPFVFLLLLPIGMWVNASERYPERFVDALSAILSDGTVTADQLKLKDGSAAAPALIFTADPDTGLYRIGANNLGVAANGAIKAAFGASVLKLYTDLDARGNKIYSDTQMLQLGNTMSTSHSLGQYDVGVAVDLEVDGSAYFDSTVQFGSLSRHTDLVRARFGSGDLYWFHYNTAPATNTFELVSTSVDGGGTDGVIFSVDDGADDVAFTGGASFGDSVVLAAHQKFTAVKTGLTDAGSNAFVRIAVAQGTHIGGSIIYSVHCDDGTDYQVRNGTLTFAAVNKAGTETCDTQIAAASTAAALSSGTLSASFACASNAADTIDVAVTPNSSLTPTTLEIHYYVILDADATITGL